MKVSYSEVRQALRYRDAVLHPSIDRLAMTGIYTNTAGYLRDHADPYERETAQHHLNVLASLPPDVLTYIEDRDRLRFIEPAIARHTATVKKYKSRRRAYQTRAALLRQRVKQAQAALDTAVLLGETTHRQRATLARREAVLRDHTGSPPPELVSVDEAQAALAQLLPERDALVASLAATEGAWLRYFPARERSGAWTDEGRRSLALTPADWERWDAQCARWRSAVALEDYSYDRRTGLLRREGWGPVTQRTVYSGGERVPVPWLIPWLVLEEDFHPQAEVLNLWIRPQCPYAGDRRQGYWWRWSDVLAHCERLACHSSGAYSRMDDGRPTPPGAWVAGWWWFMRDGRVIAPGIGEIKNTQIVQLQF